MEKSERLGRQVRPGIKPGTSRQPVFSAKLLRNSWGVIVVEDKNYKFVLSSHRQRYS